MPEQTNEIERRYLMGEVTTETSDDGVMRIVGTSPVFNQRSEVLSNEYGKFIEEIDPSALDDILPFADVRGRFDHSVVLARTKNGTLKLTKTDTGIRYEMILNPEDPEAISAYAKVKRGDVDGSSFMFTVPKDGEKWRRENGMPIRRVLKFSSFMDVGPVTYPAYPQTSAAVRSYLEAYQHEEQPPTSQAEPGGSEEAVKARQAARRRTLELLDV